MLKDRQCILCNNLAAGGVNQTLPVYSSKYLRYFKADLDIIIVCTIPYSTMIFFRPLTLRDRSLITGRAGVGGYKL